MQINLLNHRLILHDSSIEAIEYDEEHSQVKLKVSLCNYMQSNYVKTMPEQIEGPIHVEPIQHVSANMFEFLGQLLTKTWRYALQEQFPNKQFDIIYTTEPNEYGPTLTFYQNESGREVG